MEWSEVEIDGKVKEKKEQGIISEKKSRQDIFSDKTVTSLERKWKKQYGIDHRKEKHLTREEGRPSWGSENCDSETEQSEAHFEVENHKFENEQPLNKNLSDLNQPIQYKERYTEFDNFIQVLGKVLYSYAICALTFIWVGGGGNFTPCWFSLNGSEMVKALTVPFVAFSNILLEMFVPDLVFLTRPSLQILGKTQTWVFPISEFLVNPL